MTLPGHEVDLVEAPPSVAALTDTGIVFAFGKATTAVPLEEVYSIDQFVRYGGERDPASFLYDGLDSFFREGGYKAIISTAVMSANEAAVLALLENFKDDALGIGQIIAPGLTTPTAQLAIAEAAFDMRRCYVADGIDTATASALLDQAAAVTGATTNWGDRFSGLFAPWDIAPGVTSNTTRTIPPSGRICGNIARNQALGETENTAAAGDFGMAKWVQSVTHSYSDADRKTLNEAGVNVSILRRGRVRTMGFRSLADQVMNKNWSWFQCSRLVMRIRLDLDLVCENFEFSKLDAKQHTINRFRSRISAALQPYFDSDDLFGATPEEAYSVDVGPAVNTTDTLARDELHAKIALRTTDAAERIFIDIAKIPNTESIPSLVA